MAKERAPFTAAEFETWLVPRDAVVRLTHLSPAVAKDTIVRRLRHNQLRASARKLSVTFENQRTQQVEYAFIWPKAWDVESALWSVWDSGDFSTHMPLGDEVVAASYFGVRFDPAGIEAIVADAPKVSGPVPSQPRESAKTVKKGGRPPKPWWDDLLIEMFRQIWDGDLQPQNQADIEKAMLDWASANGHDLSESAVKVPAKKLFAALNTEGKN